MRSGWSVCVGWVVVLVGVVVGLPKLVWMVGCGRMVVHGFLPAVLSWGRIYCWHCCVNVLQFVQGIECYCVYDCLVSGVCLFG